MGNPSGHTTILRLKGSEFFVKAMDIMKDLTPALTFTLDELGLRTQATDECNILLLDFELFNRHGFDVVRNAVGVSRHSITIPLAWMSKILRSVKPADDVDLVIPAAAGNPVQVIATSQEPPRNISTFNIRQIEILDATPVSCDHFVSRYPGGVIMESNVFAEIVNNLKVIHDNVKIILCKDGLTISAVNEMVEKTVQVSSRDVIVEMPNGVRIEQHFRLRYLLVIAKASKISTELLFQMGQDCPLCITFKLHKVGKFRFFLAPLVDPDQPSDADDDDTNDNPVDLDDMVEESLG